MYIGQGFDFNGDGDDEFTVIHRVKPLTAEQRELGLSIFLWLFLIVCCGLLLAGIGCAVFYFSAAIADSSTSPQRRAEIIRDYAWGYGLLFGALLVPALPFIGYYSLKVLA